jgi:hypothetical protein
MRSVLVIGLCMLSYLISAQGISTVTADRDTVLVGDVIKLRVKVRLPINKVVEGLTFEHYQNLPNRQYLLDTTRYESIGDIEIIDYGVWAPRLEDSIIPSKQWSVKKEDGYLETENIIQIAIYNEGIFEIPGPIIVGDSTLDMVKVDGARIAVVAPNATLPNDSLAIHHTLDIVHERKQITDYLHWIAIVLGIVAMIFLFKRFRPRPKITPAMTASLTPAALASRELDILNQSKPWLTGNIDDYQVRFTSVIRKYILDQWNIKAPEMTTSQILAAMGKVQISRDDHTALSEMLDIADLVKFAQHRPEIDMHQELLDDAFVFIDNTSMP